MFVHDIHLERRYRTMNILTISRLLFTTLDLSQLIHYINGIKSFLHYTNLVGMPAWGPFK